MIVYHECRSAWHGNHTHAFRWHICATCPWLLFGRVPSVRIHHLDLSECRCWWSRAASKQRVTRCLESRRRLHHAGGLSPGCLRHRHVGEISQFQAQLSMITCMLSIIKSWQCCLMLLQDCSYEARTIMGMGDCNTRFHQSNTSSCGSKKNVGMLAMDAANAFSCTELEPRIESQGSQIWG